MSWRALLLTATCATAIAAQDHVLGSTGPIADVVEALAIDGDGDGRAELVVVRRDGRATRHVCTDAGLVARGTLRLADPHHTLFAFADVAPAPGIEFVVADGGGTGWLRWPDDDGERDAEPVPLARRARLSLRTDAPQRSPFVRDLDRDGRLDLLLPTRDGVRPFVQEATDDGDDTPRFRALPTLPVPVQSAVERAERGRARELRGSLVVPQLETDDLDGDGRPDLLTRDGQRHAFWLLGEDGGFREPIVVDLAQFRDSTPKAAVELGSTLVASDRQLLQRGDIDGDGIPDFVIAHRRKVWTFLAGRDGPQFTKARTQAVADDVTAMLLVDLDDDGRGDLLTFQVQLPGVGALLLGLVQSIDIDVKCVGYRSEDSAFGNLPQWRRTVTLRVPPVLTLLGQQEELVQRFLDIVNKTRLGVRGAFTGGAANDLALVRADGGAIELFAGDDAPPKLDSARGRRLMRELLFEDPATVFDLDRVFALVSGLVDELSGALVGERAPRATLPLRDPEQWRVVDLFAGEFDGQAGDELVVAYVTADADEAAPRVYDLLRWPSNDGPK